MYYFLRSKEGGSYYKYVFNNDAETFAKKKPIVNNESTIYTCGFSKFDLFRQLGEIGHFPRDKETGMNICSMAVKMENIEVFSKMLQKDCSLIIDYSGESIFDYLINSKDVKFNDQLLLVLIEHAQIENFDSFE